MDNQITTLKPIPMVAVIGSSQIAERGYDAESQTLAIRFARGAKIYRYSSVPPEMATKFAEAESLGKFFGAQIKGKFDYTYADPEADPASGEAD